MNILITGITGFIGQRLGQGLAQRGHHVIGVGRRPSTAPSAWQPAAWVQADFVHATVPSAWLKALHGVDVVVNAVGILREQGTQTFAALHVQGPRALFAAAVQAGVRRVVQVSALGADDQAVSRYHRTKREADDFLLSLPLSATVAQPSLIHGPGGASAHLFSLLASLPLTPVPGRGNQQVQPVHLDDVVQALVVMVETDTQRGQRVPLVGPEAMTLRTYLAELRRGMGLPPARLLPVPMGLMRLAARGGDHLPSALLDRESLQMLERGNTASPDTMAALLGHAPRPVAAFVAPDHRDGARATAQLAWLLPLLRYSVAAVWILTGIVSLGLYPVDASLSLLAAVGVPAVLAPWTLYGAALLDLALGVGALVLKRRRWLWLGQIALMLGYTAILTWRLPEFWLHPFGPLLKNLPMLAALCVLLTFEKR